MSNFKIGDKVRCINNQYAANSLIVGEIYNITDISRSGLLIFIEVDGRYQADRFELVEEKKKEDMSKETTERKSPYDFRPGDKLQCVDAWESGGNLVDGMIYEFVRYEDNYYKPGSFNATIFVKGKEISYFANRFRLVEDIKEGSTADKSYNPMANLYGIGENGINTRWQLTWLMDGGHIGLYSVELECQIIQISGKVLSEVVAEAELIEKYIRGNYQFFKLLYKTAVENHGNLDRVDVIYELFSRFSKLGVKNEA